MKKYYIIFGLLFLNSASFADSGCWPEEHLVGKTAIGFIEGVNYAIFKTSDGAKCKINIYENTADKKPQSVECEKIECIKGECGDAGDYTALPVEESKDLFVRVQLKDHKKAWLKLNEKPEIKSILETGTEGTIFPLTTLILDAPNGKPLKKKATEKIAYTVSKIKKVNNEDWVEVDITPILSAEPPVKVGKSIGKGYFLFRNKENKVNAVLSHIWCD